jgi:hypothetical protein
MNADGSVALVDAMLRDGVFDVLGPLPKKEQDP